MVKAKRIIVDSIQDHFITQISSKKTPKEMFDALSNLFEGKNINRRMTLRNQLKGLKIQKEETKKIYVISCLGFFLGMLPVKNPRLEIT